VAIPLTADRLSRLKRAYTTHRLSPDSFATLLDHGVPEAGDVVLARVVEIGQQERLEAPDGRKQTLFPGDEIVVCYGNRYAPAQYEAVVPTALGPCDLVAAGGVAATALSWHAAKDEPTAIDVLGFIGDDDGRKLRLADHALPVPTGTTPVMPRTIIVAGTSMDSGKTTTAAGLIRGMVAAGLRVGSAKVTGTGAGGDRFHMADAGALPALDFTHAGIVSTYKVPMDQILDGIDLLTRYLAAAEVDVAVIEVADGLYHEETREVLTADVVRRLADAVVFAAGDAVGAVKGVEELRRIGLPVAAVSGLLTASPLATREARGALDIPVLDLEQLWTADHELAGSLEAPALPEPRLGRGRQWVAAVA
jgi:molybdopterin-guanine dinucleotide biosynthesis protein